jgi:IclR family mhp operon transcriptional activator
MGQTIRVLKTFQRRNHSHFLVIGARPRHGVYVCPDAGQTAFLKLTRSHGQISWYTYTWFDPSIISLIVAQGLGALAPERIAAGARMQDQDGVKSIKKVLRALRFLNSNGESTVSDVARGIGVPRTTAYRLLHTLSCEGFVEKQPHSDVYRITSMVRHLSSGFGDCEMIVEVASPLISRAGAEIGWPLAFATPRGENMVVRITTDYDTSMAVDRYMIGFGTPILHSPTGFCYLAFCDDDTRQSILAAALSAPYPPDVYPYQGKHLEHYLRQIRTRGYCNICYKEYPEGGLAVPVMVNGKVVGGLIMRYMKSILLPDQLEGKYVPMMRQLADGIAAAYYAHDDGIIPEMPNRVAASPYRNEINGHA